MSAAPHLRVVAPAGPAAGRGGRARALLRARILEQIRALPADDAWGLWADDIAALVGLPPEHVGGYLFLLHRDGLIARSAEGGWLPVRDPR